MPSHMKNALRNFGVSLNASNASTFSNTAQTLARVPDMAKNVSDLVMMKLMMMMMMYGAVGIASEASRCKCVAEWDDIEQYPGRKTRSGCSKSFGTR